MFVKSQTEGGEASEQMLDEFPRHIQVKCIKLFAFVCVCVCVCDAIFRCILKDLAHFPWAPNCWTHKDRAREKETEKEASDKLSRRVEGGRRGETVACGGFLVVQ